MSLVASWTDTVGLYASQTGLTVPQFSLGLGLGVAVITAGGIYFFSGSNRPNPHGPGPKGVPILGNAGDIPTNDTPWIDYMQMAKKYGA